MRKQYGIIRNAMKKLQILMLAGLAAAAARGAVMDGLAAKVDNECIMIGDVLAEVRRNPVAREQFAAAAHDKAKLAALYQAAIDALIAATAKVDDLVLVTRNVRDMEGMGVKLLNPFSR